jgi:hypothetical protein
MSYRKYLTRYGSPSDTAEIRCNIFLVDPAKIAEHKDIIWRDKIIAENIFELEAIISALKDYRHALAARYGELETMPYKRLLMLDRCVHWKGHKEYIVTITRICEDKTRIQELREVYPGKERHKAIARYHELQKQYPGIESEMDITKQKWER